MMELSEEAKKLIKDEFVNKSTALNNVTREAKFWLWVVRLAFLIVLGGSIYGVYKIDDYVDSKIAARVGQLDRLPIALADANAGDFSGALITMDELWFDIYKKNVKVSESFEETFLSNYVWILSSVTYAPSSEHDDYWAWIKNQWVRLNKNDRFIRLRAESKDDVTFQKSLALMSLKINPSLPRLDESLQRIKHAINHEEYPVDKSYLYYDMALINLLKDDLNSAVLNLKKASELHPVEFYIDNWSKYKASYVGGPDFEMWKFLAHEFSIFELDKRLEKAYKLAKSKPNNGN